MSNTATVSARGFDQFALGGRDAFNGIESFHVGVADVGDYADVGRAISHKRRISPGWFMAI